MVVASQNELTIADVVPVTEAEGPGKRFAIWFQGCPLRCPRCCNPEMLPFEGGKAVEIGALLSQIESAAEQGIEGITLLGGEPFAHAAGASIVAREVQMRGLSVMIFSGYVLEELRDMAKPAVDELLRDTDILVDGPYVREQVETNRRWIGSSNQRIHFLSARYRSDDSRWDRPNTLEIRLEDGELSINGFPAQQAATVWKRIGRTTKSDERP